MKNKKETSKVVFWVGAIWFGTGQVISFYPGAEMTYFAISALLCSFGLLITGKMYRIVAVLLVAASVVVAVSGYERGKEYKTWLETRDRSSPPSKN